jgi:2-polyprenyl-3-methyl-5-hydroxy-6-metoxy-1,4-benzoquinol methylase
MHGYKVDHRYFSFNLSLPANLSGLRGEPYLICKADLETLAARIITGYAGRTVKHTLVKLRDTPHFQYVCGNQAPYLQYLETYGIDVGFGAEHSRENFERLLSANEKYLEGAYSSNYIICEQVNTKTGVIAVILDGVHRASILLAQGIREVPVAFIFEKNPLPPLAQLDRYLHDYRDDFPEWYTPLEIKGRVIHERTYPGFKERPEFLFNKERGKSKWDFIIAKNLPDLKGKTVCDLGCNAGLYSIYMSQLGAQKVDGYDRAENVVQPTNEHLPRQNVVQQAYFVKNLFSLAGEQNLARISYIECDIATLDFSALKYDFFFSCCVLYHFGAKFEECIQKISANIPEVFLQTNLGHRGPALAALTGIEYHRDLLQKYGYAVKIDAPAGYNYPVIYGNKSL